VIADPDGGYLARFFERYRGDVILNPFEPHSLKWDWFSEIRNSYDVEQLASGLVPSSNDASGRNGAVMRARFSRRSCGAATKLAGAIPRRSGAC
jgi:hypothetical protein